MEGKKISFGFMKTKKLEKPIVEEEKQFIECLEEKSIKVVGGEAVTEKAPLIIPVKPNTLQTAERMKQIAEEVESAVSQPDTEEKPESHKAEPIPENETLEQRATRELLEDSKKKIEVETPQYTISVPADKLPLDGQKESTLDDYEAVPVQEFGLAMLRGMGWQPGKDQSKYKEPQLRPKGLGLGADKVIKDNQKKNASKNTDESLPIVKNAFVKITTGKFSGYYGKIISLDEENGRVMVDIPMKKETVSLSEFMMLPVTKAEFDKESRVINSEQYEEFKKNDGKSSKRTDSSKDNREASSSKKRNENKERRNYESERRERDNESFSNGKSLDAIDKKDPSNNDDKFRGKREEKRKYSSTDSLNSLSDTDERRKREEAVRHHGSSDSDSSDEHTKHKKSKKSKHSSDKKRDIDKKRKGKKKKRDRDRSPNYRKHKSKN